MKIKTQSRTQSFVPLDQRSENESSEPWEQPFQACAIDVDCAVNRITRIRLFPLLFQKDCSQSSRFPTAGQGERMFDVLQIFSFKFFQTRSNSTKHGGQTVKCLITK